MTWSSVCLNWFIVTAQYLFYFLLCQSGRAAMLLNLVPWLTQESCNAKKVRFIQGDAHLYRIYVQQFQIWTCRWLFYIQMICKHHCVLKI